VACERSVVLQKHSGDDIGANTIRTPAASSLRESRFLEIRHSTTTTSSSSSSGSSSSSSSSSCNDPITARHWGSQAAAPYEGAF
jgi:activator of HSP90 ATPase